MMTCSKFCFSCFFVFVFFGVDEPPDRSPTLGEQNAEEEVGSHASKKKSMGVMVGYLYHFAFKSGLILSRKRSLEKRKIILGGEVGCLYVFLALIRFWES